MGQELESLRGVRLELDLVRVSDGAVVRLTSGVADGRNGYHIGAEVIWDELVLDDHCYHVRLGPSPREEFGRNGRTKGGGVLAFIDELFWLEERWSLPPPASPAANN